jgi:hypothetical protein
MVLRAEPVEYRVTTFGTSLSKRIRHVLKLDPVRNDARAPMSERPTAWVFQMLLDRSFPHVEELNPRFLPVRENDAIFR